MRYLVMGGAGFVGSNLSAEVLKRGEELIVFDNLFRYGSSSNLNWLREKGKFKFYPYDIRNVNDVETVIQEVKPDFIFHLAGQVAMTTSIANPRLDFEVNALGTYNLLEAVRKFSPTSVILYSSSNKVYGDFGELTFDEKESRYLCREYPYGIDETFPLNFQSPYGCSKGAADQYLLDYYRMFDIQTVVFRHSSMYGGNQHATYDQGWIGWFCQKALERKKGSNEKFTISGNGKQVRDVLHVNDVIELYFNASKQIEKTCGNVYNIGGGNDNSLSLLELFQILEELLGVRLKYEKIEWRKSDQKSFIADINKARNSFNFNIKVDNITGIKNTLNWMLGEQTL